MKFINFNLRKSLSLKNLGYFSASLVLISYSPELNSSNSSTCDFSNFNQYFTDTFLTNHGISTAQIGSLISCANPENCGPIMATLGQSLTTGTFPFKGTPYSWSEIVPESSLATALAMTMIWYFHLNPTWGLEGPGYVWFPFASLVANLKNIDTAGATVEGTTCTTLFAEGTLCEAAIFMGQLYSKINMTAQSKLAAIYQCRRTAAQYKDLPTCMASVLSNLAQDTTAIPTTLAEAQAGDQINPTEAAAFFNLANDLNTILINYNSAFSSLVNCCQTANTVCNTQNGPAVTMATMTDPGSVGVAARTNLQNQVSYSPNQNIPLWQNLSNFFNNSTIFTTPSTCKHPHFMCDSSADCSTCCSGKFTGNYGGTGMCCNQAACTSDAQCAANCPAPNNICQGLELAMCIAGVVGDRCLINIDCESNNCINSVCAAAPLSNNSNFLPNIILTACGGTGPAAMTTGICALDITAMINPGTRQLFNDIIAGNLSNLATDLKGTNLIMAADINLADANNNLMTALMYAAQSTSSNALAMVQYLVTVPGINMNIQDSNQHTALWYAQNSTNPQKTAMVQVITNAQLLFDTSSTTSTLTAVQADIAAGANVNFQDSNKNTALYYAINSTNPNGPAILQYLLTLPAIDTINTPNINHLIAIAMTMPRTTAISNNSVTLAEKDIQAGININSQNPNGWTALMYAAYNLNLPLVKYLTSVPAVNANLTGTMAGNPNPLTAWQLTVLGMGNNTTLMMTTGLPIIQALRAAGATS